MRVLCIEDQDTKFSAIRNVLEASFGAEVTWARAVATSLSWLGQPWDLIVLDMNFPAAGPAGREIGRRETSGIRVLQVMKAQNIQVPVIIATAHDSFIESRDFKITSIEELEKILAAAFPETFKGIVRVDYLKDAWHSEFVSLVRGLGFERRT